MVARRERYHRDALAPFDAVTMLGPTDYICLHEDVDPKMRRAWKERNLGRHLNRFKPKSWQRPMRIDFRDVVTHAFEDMPEGERFLPSVLAGWDNTPRSGLRGVVYEGFTPELLQAYFEKAIDRLSNHSPSEKIIFLKAWNEWAEGNVLEPDNLHGHELLNATRAAVWPHGGAAASINPKQTEFMARLLIQLRDHCLEAQLLDMVRGAGRETGLGNSSGNPMKASIIMAAHNSAGFIQAAIASALAQTERDFELIVVDDGSTDDTGGVVRALAAKDSRVHLHQHDVARGPAAARTLRSGGLRGSGLRS